MKKVKKPWPTKKAMKQVYEMKLWGGTNQTEFYSGEGSHNSQIITPYITAVKQFLTSFEKPLIVADLGCGDFNIGRNLFTYTQKYFAIDIVTDLITYNQQKFKAENLEFLNLDIATAKLPDANCIIIRQVLQHLSNNEVKNVVEKLYQYQYIILTEHIPKGDFISNKDIISGQGIRLKKQSGLNLLEAPFNFKIKEKKELSKIMLANNKGVIVTKLYTVF